MQSTTNFIDVQVDVIKKLLNDQRINLDVDNQTAAERLLVRQVEKKLTEIIEILR